MSNGHELFLQKLDIIESLLRENINEFKKETNIKIDRVWNDQRRQDNIIQDIIQIKSICVEEFDDKLRASEINIDEKIEHKSKGWWKKAAIIYGIIILIVSFLAFQGAAMKDEITNRVTNTEFEKWRQIEFSHIAEEIRDLRKEIKEEIRDVNDTIDKYMEKNKQSNKEK